MPRALILAPQRHPDRNRRAPEARARRCAAPNVILTSSPQVNRSQTTAVPVASGCEASRFDVGVNLRYVGTQTHTQSDGQPGDRDIRLPGHQFQRLAAQQSRDNLRKSAWGPLSSTPEGAPTPAFGERSDAPGRGRTGRPLGQPHSASLLACSGSNHRGRGSKASGSSWGRRTPGREFAAVFRSTRPAFLKHERADGAQGAHAGGRQGGDRPWGPRQTLEVGGGQLRGD
jgi:hypothetical protein